MASLKRQGGVILFDFERSLQIANTWDCLALPGYCFDNVVRALHCRAKGLSFLRNAWYVEGHALTDAPMIITHAWLELPDGTILDPTYAAIQNGVWHPDIRDENLQRELSRQAKEAGKRTGYQGYYSYARYTRQELKGRYRPNFPIVSPHELAIRELALYTDVLGIRWDTPVIREQGGAIMATLKTKEELQQRKQEQLQRRSGEYHINLEKPPVVYSRQSTKDQPVKNKEAAAMQTDDLLDLAEEYGWDKVTAWLFVENYYDKHGNYNIAGKSRDASGKLRIDQRAGLQHVIYLIESDQTSAVICRETSRLFRDETLVGPVTFAAACREHNVVIITPHHVYDFNAPGRDDFHRFIEEAKVAAAYLKNMQEIAHAARYRKGAHGAYSGHTIPTGFMLDDSRENYLPNPVWSPIVAQLTRRYRQLDGSIALLRREIIGKCIFPDLPPDIAKRVGAIHLEKVQGGYTIKSRSGLVWILTNPTNIGHIHFDGQITKRHAHPAIVDEDDYFFALYHLADVDLDGKPIERPQRAIRIQHKGTIEPRDGLLSGVRRSGRPVLTTDQGNVYLLQLAYATNAAYVIKNGRDTSLSFSGSIDMNVADTVFETRLLARLDDLFFMAHEPYIRAGIPPVTYESAEMAAIAGELDALHEQQEQQATVIVNHFHQVRQEVIQGLAGVAKSILELKRQIGVLKNDLDRDRREPFMDAEDREGVYATLKHLRADLAAYERKQKEAASIVATIEEAGNKLATARDYWPSMSLEKKKIYIRLVTQDILLHDSRVGFMEMTVTWHPLMGEPRQERAIILQKNSNAANWTEEETTILKQKYPYSTKREILHLLPNRSWLSCVVKASREGIKRHMRRHEGYSQSDTMSLNATLYKDRNRIVANVSGVWWCSLSPINVEGTTACTL